jgi:energy-coupling factor transport system ATP-binding protein
VAGLDLDIPAGQRVLLAGPSGAGKSTLLLALAGALGESVPGDVAGGVHLDAGPASQSVVGLVTQRPGDAVVAGRLGRDVAFGPENLGLDREETWRRVDASLAAVGLHQGREHPTNALSGGELQRLALAGALALRPGLLLLDEPTAMLDDASAGAVRTAVADVVASSGATLVVVEHRLEPWLDLVERVVVLDATGAVVADTDPGTFVSEHRERLGSAGVWMPGLPAPAPLRPPEELVVPHDPPCAVVTSSLLVELVRRSWSGSTRTRALEDVDLWLDAAAAHALVGPSGAGKSTLLAACAGLQRPTAGRVRRGEIDLHRLSSSALAAVSGWVPQAPEHGILTLRVRDEVALTSQRLGRSVDVDGVLDHLGLAHLADRNPYRLSGGEQRRLALAAALAHRPAGVLLDEPTVGQDRLTWAAVAGWWRCAADAGAVAVAATHDADLVALADHVHRLDSGRLG